MNIMAVLTNSRSVRSDIKVDRLLYYCLKKAIGEKGVILRDPGNVVGALNFDSK